MEIGPITGVRAASLLSVHRIDSALRPVFEIDPSAPTADETYSSRSQTPDRGLADEDSALVEDEDPESEASPTAARTGTRINFFA
ncbi:MAG: hypothetical protein WBM14_09030 [Terracidiphilus sp.]|jgi:hypothetical protein